MSRWSASVLAGAAMLALSARPAASSWIFQPLSELLPEYCFIGMIRIGEVRKGDTVYYARKPLASLPYEGILSLDTLRGTVTGILKNACASPVGLGMPATFLRPSDDIPETRDTQGLGPGDSALVLSGTRDLDTPILKRVASPDKRAVIATLLRHVTDFPGKPAELAEDMSRFDQELTPSALAQFEKLGPAAASAAPRLAALLQSPASAEKKADILHAIRAITTDKEAFRRLLESTIRTSNLSRETGLFPMLARTGPLSVPEFVRIAETHEDKWVRYSAVSYLCFEEIRGPGAKALAEKKMRDDKEAMVRHIAKRILHECYGGPPD